MKVISACLALTLGIIPAGPTPPTDITPPVVVDVHHSENVEEVHAWRKTPAAKGNKKLPGKQSSSTPEGNKKTFRARMLLPACKENMLPASQINDVSCTEALSLCRHTPDPHDQMFWIYLGPPGVAHPRPDQWEATGRVCRSPGHTASPEQRATPAMTVEQFRRLPLPAGRIHVQPASGRTLINIPTNFWVDAGQVTIPVTILGSTIRVRATPISYTWNFGDGTTLPTKDPGAPYPQLRTTHTYTRPETVHVGLTTIYRGEYIVAGNHWTPIEGTASVQSPTRPVTAIEARAALVQDTLPNTSH
jgi:hypothetical protein